MSDRQSAPTHRHSDSCRAVMDRALEHGAARMNHIVINHASIDGVP